LPAEQQPTPKKNQKRVFGKYLLEVTFHSADKTSTTMLFISTISEKGSNAAFKDVNYLMLWEAGVSSMRFHYCSAPSRCRSKPEGCCVGC
jgi:hypothetical protein